MLCGELIMTNKFDFNEALKAIQSGKSIEGKDGVLAPLIKQLTEAALEGELESILQMMFCRIARMVDPAKRSKRRIDIQTPRDRAGTFEPQFVKKHQTSVSDEIESKIPVWARHELHRYP